MITFYELLIFFAYFIVTLFFASRTYYDNMIKNTFNRCIQKLTINKFHPYNYKHRLNSKEDFHDLNQLYNFDIFICRKYYIRSDINKFSKKKFGGYNSSMQLNFKFVYRASHFKEIVFYNSKKLKEFNTLFNCTFPNFVYVCKCVSICTFDFEKKILQKLLKILNLKALIMSYEIVKMFYIDAFELLRFERHGQTEELIRNYEDCKECEDNIITSNDEINSLDLLLKNYFNDFEFHFKDYYQSAVNLQRYNN